ncbi:hypothetical protein EJ03DRAFT_55575 [Teratosphaeria nubilosa]|uniref:Uncharacterized protein n=1 Tax=Teratosphaeria nubilosa TaxID=161662 RepID=A0A6G1LD16_9PEZI|nr:hypothetical protein EJ03DRAFT_55575 [Teratosphaeria nubilosa]
MIGALLSIPTSLSSRAHDGEALYREAYDRKDEARDTNGKGSSPVNVAGVTFEEQLQYLDQRMHIFQASSSLRPGTKINPTRRWVVVLYKVTSLRLEGRYIQSGSWHKGSTGRALQQRPACASPMYLVGSYRMRSVPVFMIIAAIGADSRAAIKVLYKLGPWSSMG